MKDTLKKIGRGTGKAAVTSAKFSGKAVVSIASALISDAKKNVTTHESNIQTAKETMDSWSDSRLMSTHSSGSVKEKAAAFRLLKSRGYSYDCDSNQWS